MELIPWNRLLGSLKVWKFRLDSSMKYVACFRPVPLVTGVLYCKYVTRVGSFVSNWQRFKIGTRGTYQVQWWDWSLGFPLHYFFILYVQYKNTQYLWIQNCLGEGPLALYESAGFYVPPYSKTDMTCKKCQCAFKTWLLLGALYLNNFVHPLYLTGIPGEWRKAIRP